MRLIQLLLPVRDNEKRPFPRAEFERVRLELTERFGGVTAFFQSPASGLWKDEQQGDTVSDQLVLFEVMVDRADPEWWKNYRAELERRFRQDVVVVRALPVETL